MKKILIVVILLLLPANLFPPVVAWAVDDTKPAGKCETVTTKNPIPESLSDECFCKAYNKSVLHKMPDGRLMMSDGEQMPTTQRKIDCLMKFEEEELIEIGRDCKMRRTFFKPRKEGILLPTSPYKYFSQDEEWAKNRKCLD